MNKKIFIVLFFAFAFFVINADAQEIGVGGSIGTIKRGGSVRGSIVLNIPSGYHINSSRPREASLIPTRVSVSSKNARVSAVNYPRGKSRRFTFSDTALSVYDGRAAISFNISVPSNFKGNSVKVRVLVSYQSCNDEACFPPRKKEITLTAKVG